MHPLPVSQLDMIKLETLGMLVAAAFPDHDTAFILMKDGAGAVITDDPKHLPTIEAAVQVAKASFEEGAEFPPLVLNNDGDVTNMLTGEPAPMYRDDE